MSPFSPDDRLAGETAPPDEPSAKAPPPGLALRAAPPRATRLRQGVVRLILIGGVALVSGALTWAFVIQPELRDRARAQAAQGLEDEARGAVRPSEAVTDQPATYDRLPEPRGATAGPEPAGAAPPAASGAPSAPVDLDPRPTPAQLAARSGLFFAAPSGGAGAAPPDSGADHRAAVADLDAMYNGSRLTAPLSPYELKAGAIIPAVLLTGIDTEHAGPVVAAVSQNVFDTVSGRHLVLPQGARLIGRHDGDSAWGERRAVVVWDRLILPNGKSLRLSEEPGVDTEGVVGLRGQADRRLLPLAVGTLFAGAVTTLGQAARDRSGRDPGGLMGDAGNAAAIEGAQVGGRLIDRELQVRPSIRLRPGAPVRVMITRDLILEPYVP